MTMGCCELFSSSLHFQLGSYFELLLSACDWLIKKFLFLLLQKSAGRPGGARLSRSRKGRLAHASPPASRDGRTMTSISRNGPSPGY